MYCKKCGGKLESYASNCAFCGTPVEKYNSNAEYVKPEKKVITIKPMTMWKWVGLTLLPLLIPVGTIIYLVLMFKWAFGKNPDLTLKGFAKSALFMMVLLAIAAATFFILKLTKVI